MQPVKSQFFLIHANQLAPPIGRRVQLSKDHGHDQHDCKQDSTGCRQRSGSVLAWARSLTRRIDTRTGIKIGRIVHQHNIGTLGRAV